jgi:hypothetical protein
MRVMGQETQGKKDDRVTAAVTKAEKQALTWVALTVEGVDGISGLLRRYSIGEALELHDELRAKLGRAA